MGKAHILCGVFSSTNLTPKVEFKEIKTNLNGALMVFKAIVITLLMSKGSANLLVKLIISYSALIPI
jgi:hypothetical protein